MALTTGEATQLAELETVIERGLKTFVEVGNALLEIRDKRLYRAEYATFEAYCRQRWGLRQSRAYQLLDAAEVVGNLKSSTIVELPANEAQVRPLAKLTPAEQRQAWEKAVETAPNGKITAAHIEQTIRQMTNPLTSTSSTYFHVEETDHFTCPRCHQRTAQVNGGAICLNDGCRAKWTSRADYEAEVKSLNQESLTVELLDKERRGRLKAQFAEAVNHLPADRYSDFVERVEELLSEFDLLRIHLNR